MVRLALIGVLLVFLVSTASAQVRKNDDPLDLFGEIEELLEQERIAAGKPLDEADIMPEFPGGVDAMYNWLNSRIIYPEMAQRHGLEGVVIAEFVVDETGKVRDVAIIQGVGGGCNEQVRKAIKRMPEWQPGSHNGQNVRVKQEVRISFFL